MSYYAIIDGELYHHGVKGMRWGRRRYQNEDGSLTEAGKKRYANHTPTGPTTKMQQTQMDAYNRWRHAKGRTKANAVKELQRANADIEKAMRDQLEFEGKHPYSKRDIHDHATTAHISGRKAYDKYGNELGYYATKAERMFDPNRRAKNIASSAGRIAAGAALGVLGNKAANELYKRNIVDRQIAMALNTGVAIVAASIGAKGISKAVNDHRQEKYIRRFNKELDRVTN